MPARFADNQPASYHNFLQEVAIVGAGGQLGSIIVQELLKSGKHAVTAISRIDSTSQPPDGVHLAKVDSNDESSIVDVLKEPGCFDHHHQYHAPPPNTSTKLVEAAAKTGVKWVLPDEWGACNGINLEWERDVFLGPPKQAIRELIEKLAVSSWTGISDGFWYEFSRCMASTLGKKKSLSSTIGNARIDTSTWEHEARAVTSLLSLKILPDDKSDTSITLDRDFRNRFAFLSSFCVTQRDIFESVKRVTGTTNADWSIKSESSKERYDEGIEDFQSGNMFGFVKCLYARSF